MQFFSNNAINLGRQPEVDLLRGFTALILIICHVGLYLGNNISKGLWTFCDIIGSEFGAPIFMALMGISQVYSHHQAPKDLFKRGINLFIMGYVLNFFRSILPLLILGSVDEWTSIEAFFVVDILQFAGLTFMLIALFKKLKLPDIGILALSIVMVVIDQFNMLPESVPWNSAFLTGLVNLFCPITSWSCFPLFIWFFFPAFGLVFGDLLTRCDNKKKLYSILLPIGLVGVLFVYLRFYFLYPNYTAYYWGNNFYYMGLENVLLTTFFIGFSLAFWFFADRILPDFFRRFLNFLSRHLNIFYLISWLVISILIHAQVLCGWTFGDLAVTGLTVLVVLVCAVLTKMWLPMRRNRNRK